MSCTFYLEEKIVLIYVTVARHVNQKIAVIITL